jgi:hypothetical protein
MQLLPTRIFLLLLLLCTGNLAIAQLKFSATISPSTIGKDEVAELKLMVENAGSVEQINPPSLQNFIVVSGPNQESGMESINGVTHQYIGITYLLKPKAKGDFTIGEAFAKADGKGLKSNKVKLKVVNEATGNSANRNSPFSSMMQMDAPPQETSYNDFILKKGENVQDKVSKNLFVLATADKTICYVGEPVVVTYKLYTRLKSESNIVKNPSFNGFSVIDLAPPQSGNSYAVEKLNGREYNVYTLRKVQLYPLQSGEFELEIASIENNVHFVKGEYLQRGTVTDVFGDLIPGAVPKEAMVDEKVTIQSKPLSITVKPLPEAGKPASFNGAVGNFTVDVALEKDSLTTDDAGQLRLLLAGNGNFTLLPAPEVAWPAGLEGYEPAVKEGLNRLSVPVSGSKIFDYPFTFAAAGVYTIPSIEFSFFDVASGKYKTVSTKPLTLTVKKGTGKKPVIVADAQRGRRESFFEMIFTNRWMIIVPVALLIIGGLLVWIRFDNKKQAKQAAVARQEIIEEKAAEEQLPVNPLAITEIVLMGNDTRLFYETLNKELHTFLATRLKLAPENISRKTIADGLDQSGIGIADSFAIQQLLDDVRLQLYTPFADDNKREDYYVEAVRLVGILKKTGAAGDSAPGASA